METSVNIVDVTPQMAIDWLERNKPTGQRIVRNRPVRRSKVAEFATYMKDGRWVFNGTSIVFGENGNLIDGQHRLLACISADAPFRTLVVGGCGEDAATSIDIGEGRRPGDLLSMYGQENSINLAAALQLLHLYKTGPMSRMTSVTARLKKFDLVPFMLKHPKMQRSLSFCSDHRIKRLMSSSVAAFLHYVFSEKNEEMADTFFALIKSGANLHEFHPVLVLRNRLLTMREGTGRKDRKLEIVYTIKAWNAFAEGRNIRILRYNKGEPFPPISNV